MFLVWFNKVLLCLCNSLVIKLCASCLQEIRERAVFSVINEGFKVLEEGIVDKASDIDVLM